MSERALERLEELGPTDIGAWVHDSESGITGQVWGPGSTEQRRMVADGERYYDCLKKDLQLVARPIESTEPTAEEPGLW